MFYIQYYLVLQMCYTKNGKKCAPKLKTEKKKKLFCKLHWENQTSLATADNMFIIKFNCKMFG